jgi:hypothetical protein
MNPHLKLEMSGWSKDRTYQHELALARFAPHSVAGTTDIFSVAKLATGSSISQPKHVWNRIPDEGPAQGESSGRGDRTIAARGWR